MILKARDDDKVEHGWNLEQGCPPHPIPFSRRGKSAWSRVGGI